MRNWATPSAWRAHEGRAEWRRSGAGRTPTWPSLLQLGQTPGVDRVVILPAASSVVEDAGGRKQVRGAGLRPELITAHPMIFLTRRSRRRETSRVSQHIPSRARWAGRSPEVSTVPLPTEPLRRSHSHRPTALRRALGSRSDPGLRFTGSNWDSAGTSPPSTRGSAGGRRS